MRLKRGIERESCDFCHGRKIKCDRAARAAAGLDACSACELRALACNVDDSNDIRLQRRKRQPKNTPKVTAETVQPAAPAPLTLQNIAQPDPVPQPVPSSATVDDTFSDTLFDLNAESILFLDQVFMGDLATPWNDSQALGLFLDQPMDSQPHHPDLTNPPAPMYDTSIDHYQDLWQSCDMGRGVFHDALRAYFTFAALSLPITPEDAFWTDVQANEACQPLVCAVACRGMPFTHHADKWTLQQRLACSFRRLFLEQQRRRRSREPRVDDIEALALMVAFPYEQTDDDVNALQDLFLSHDALVLMALQCRDDTPQSVSRASERRTLLFWHVYGLDAFNSLDWKTASRIPETEASPEISIGSGYLDAVLSLALVARKILTTLCTQAVKRHGVKYADVSSLYHHLTHWKTSQTGIQHTHLQNAVLQLLCVNCYMQIENWVEEHGVSVASVGDEATAARVEYESLRALETGVDTIRVMESQQVVDFALVDLAPSILRDICVGLCVWTCARGRKALQESVQGIYRVREGADRWKGYLDVVSLLRRVAAGAVSHCDTASRLAMLDGQVTSFKDILAEKQKHPVA